MLSDLRQAFRTLTASKGFSLLIVVVLAVGISANTAMFSIVNGVLLKPLPFAEGHRLVSVDTTVRGEPDNTSYPDFLDWQAQSTSFSTLGVYATTGTTLTGMGEATGMSALVVSPDLLTLLGVALRVPRLHRGGRQARRAARRSSPSRCGTRSSRDENIVGRTVTFAGDPFTIIGVMPASFEFRSMRKKPPRCGCRCGPRASPRIGPSSGTRRFCTASAA
jgi:hypothetical protein